MFLNISKVSWSRKKLAHLCQINYGKPLKHRHVGSFPVFGAGGVFTYTNECLGKKEVIFLGRKGTLGCPVYYCGPYWAIDTLFCLSNFKQVLPQFLLYALQQFDWLALSSSSTLPSLSRTTLAELEISFPSLKEQESLLKFLLLLLKRQKLLRKEKEIYQCYFKALMKKVLKKDLVGGGGRPPPNYFSVNNLDSIFTMRVGKTPPTNDLSLWGGALPWLTVSDLKDSVRCISHSKRTLSDRALNFGCVRCLKGSLVLSFKLALGRIAILEKDMYINEGLCCLGAKECFFSVEYLYYLLKFKNWQAKANLSSKGKTLNLACLKKAKVLLPIKEKQITWAKFWQQIEDCLETLNKEICLDEIYQKVVLKFLFKNTPKFQRK